MKRRAHIKARPMPSLAPTSAVGTNFCGFAPKAEAIAEQRIKARAIQVLTS
jgi:hypothetical protein